MPLEKRLFQTGMDSDTTENLVAPSSYRYALNIRAMSSDEANEGAITNTKGNTLVTFTLPAGRNKVVGSYEYKQYGKVYYCVFNLLGNHSILEYTASTNTIAKVLQDSVLNFTEDHLITGINVVELDLNNHLFYWTDNNEEPKKINIEKGILHSQGNYVQGYANPFLPEFIYRIKTPQICEPTCVYGSDATKNTNLLTNKLFQFKVQYVYDDFEKSATSPISNIPFPALICGNNPAPSINNNIQVTVDTGSTIVTRIKILAREGNLGDFFEIVDLDKAKLQISSNTQYTYSFYNEKVYNTMDINESIKLFDNVPQKSQAQELIEGTRIVDGNILEGYDPVTVQARIDLALEEDPSPKRYGFSGRVYIGNFFDNKTTFQYGQPIHSLDGQVSNAVFGGFGGSDVENNVGSSYGQTIPLGGFVFYLKGTPYRATSVQNSQLTAAVDILSGNGNVYDSSKAKKRKDIRDAIDDKQVYGTFTFGGIPAGKYILRIASHLTTQNDLDAKNLDWQRTSTNAILVGGYQNYECPIEIRDDGTIIAGNRTIASGQFIAPSIVMDLTDPRFFTQAQAITGYVTDKDIKTPTPNTAGYLADTRIELAKVEFGNVGAGNQSWNEVLNVFSTNTGNPTGSAFEAKNDYVNSDTFTDHNGYFYFTKVRRPVDGTLKVTGVTSGNYSIGGSSLFELKYEDPTQTFSNPSGNQMKMGIFRNGDAPAGVNGNFQNYSRTVLNGNVKYNGIGVIGINILTTRGGLETSDINGDFGLIVYADTRLGTERKDVVIYGVPDSCVAVFSPSSDFYKINILNTSSVQTIFSSDYHGSYDFDSQVKLVNCIIVFILGNGSSISFKRGSIEQFGIVYYDHANRSGLTNTNDAQVLLDYTLNPSLFASQTGLKLEIPFYTEINPNTSAIWGKNKPIVSWNIFSQPPVWATHWQWVRTLNSFDNRYLQWTAKAIIYTNNDRVPTTYAAATKIGINIQSIVDYKTKFNDSQVAYAPEVGDRIRFIKDSNGNFFNNYVDLLIRDIDPAGIVYTDFIGTLPQLNAGCLFEIYTPKLQSPTSIYYEMGECYEVGDAGLPTRFHKGSGQNQSFYNLSFITYAPIPGRDPVFFQVSQPNTLADGQILNINGTTLQVIVSNVYNGNPGYTTFQSNLLFSSGNIPASGTFSMAATGVFKGGDTYSRIRSIPTASGSSVDWYIEDASFSDFFKSKVQDIGRPNKVDNTFRQVRRKSTIYYSEKFIPETKINGLSSVYDISFETYEAQYGGIQKLYNIDLRLDCFQELKCGAIPVNQVEFQSTNVTGSSVVGSSAKVLNPIRYYQGEYGIGLNPESFAVYGTSRYFFDLKRGAVLRLSNNGIFPIDDYRMNNYFTQKSKDIMATGVRPNIYGTFDVRFGEYVIAFEGFRYAPGATAGQISTPIIFKGETLAFNEKRNAWSDFYVYQPEGMVTSGVDIITFKDGNLFTHNTNPLRNNFYGVQYNSEVWVIINGEPSKNKVLAAISLESNDVWEAYEILTPNGQKSNLIVSDFEKKSNIWYAGVLRDQLTPNVTNPLIEGDVLVDTSFLIKLRNTSTSDVKMYAVNGYWQEQERSNR